MLLLKTARKVKSKKTKSYTSKLPDKTGQSASPWLTQETQLICW